MADHEFYRAIERFNEIYKLPSHPQPTLLPASRIANFQDILREEVEEGADIAKKYQALAGENGELPPAARIEILADMADWLGDVIVYCASEARRWGLPLDRVLGVIMESNFSKLGADGKPIYDDRGKVMKGPDYWKPEPRLREMLAATLQGAPQA
jgi:predicted HAD superfamily Cof-like phosphohydrolase